MVARSQGGGRSTKCDLDGRKTNPYRPATSQQQEVPAGTAIAARGYRRVPGLGGAPENELAGDPIHQHWAPVFGRRKEDSGKILMITHLRQLNSAWAQPAYSKSTTGKPSGSACH